MNIFQPNEFSKNVKDLFSSPQNFLQKMSQNIIYESPEFRRYFLNEMYTHCLIDLNLFFIGADVCFGIVWASLDVSWSLTRLPGIRSLILIKTCLYGCAKSFSVSSILKKRRTLGETTKAFWTIPKTLLVVQ